MTRFSHTIIFVSDMKRSTKFYREVFGLPLRFESPGWTEFATGSCNFALHKAADGVPMPLAADHLPPGVCQVGFTVTDLDEFHKHMLSEEVKCLQEPKVADFGGRMAVYADPDGMPISVAEAAASSASSQ
jgi:lactoylglutathione lyase